MRDELDPGTIEMHYPARTGRPALSGAAMSGAERARRYRARKLAKIVEARRDPSKASNATLLSGLRDAMALSDAGTTSGNVLVRQILAELAARYP
jgi:hypothetical protein